MNVFFLASLFESDGPITGVGPMSRTTKEGFIIVGAILFVSLLVGIWAFLSRTRRRRDARRQERRHRRSMFQNARKGVAEIKQLVREHKHRRRRHRPRNPTLAETGGLPPPRRDGTPSPPPAQPL